MRDLKTDDSGQWLLLGTMIVAVGLAVLIVFVNQSVLAGHSSSGSIMDFPKNDIRELRAESLNEAYLIGTDANLRGTNLAGRQSLFESQLGQYTKQLRYTFSAKSADANIVIYEEGLNYSGQILDNVTLRLFYDNGDTQYNETTKIYFK